MSWFPGRDEVRCVSKIQADEYNEILIFLNKRRSSLTNSRVSIYPVFINMC